MSLIVQCRHCWLLVVNERCCRRWHYQRTHGRRQWGKHEKFIKVQKLQFDRKETPGYQLVN